jgi:RIO kinase 1
MRYKWNYQEDLAEYEDTSLLPRKKPVARKKRSRSEVVTALVETADDARQGFNPSFGSKSAEKFNVSRHERAWIFEYLGGFYEDLQIIDVIKPVKGGKEATVYCCLAGPSLGVELVAAKLYRPRIFRNLRNDSLYRMGRDTMDEEGKRVGSREARALQKKTRFGQDLRQSNWLENEVSALRLLHEAGADVPRVYANNDHALLMDYLGDAEWPAPILQNVRLGAREARAIYDRVLYNIELMLAHKRIHGDLSAHNILYWQDKITIIDFPQVVSPDVNPYAYAIFERDVTRVCQYFERYGIKSDPIRMAAALWAKHVEPPDEFMLGQAGG